MAFCGNCGCKLIEGAKFCQKCGHPVRESGQRVEEERRREYAGKIYKCPSCGEVLRSFEAKCPACGLELRGVKATSSVREFALKLEAIEARRESEKVKSVFAQARSKQEISKTDAQKINLIQSFAVPNAKEDILEFMILATASINTSSFGTFYVNKSEEAIANAWLTKVKQIYAKAHSSYGGDADFAQINNLYNNCVQDVNRQKKKRVLINVLFFSWIPLLWIILIIYINISGPREEAKENERLENIVVEVQAALENEEYRHALRIADSIDYQKYDVEMERKWDIEREYWVEKVLETASENGLDLEYTPGPDVDNANDESTDEASSGGFAEGFERSMQSGRDDIKGSIDEFNRIMNGEGSSEN